jgi:tellurite resistance protein
MPGVQNILMGLGFLVLGVVVTVGSIVLTNGGFGVVAYGAILVGAIQAIWGLLQMAFYALRGKKGRAKHHFRIGTRVIVRSLIAVAAADGKLDESETVMISLIYGWVFGTRFPEPEVRRLYHKINVADFDIVEELSTIGNQVTHDDAYLVVKCMAMVAISDGEAHPLEIAIITSAAGRLGIVDDEFKECMRDARDSFDKLLLASSEIDSEPQSAA